jgi:hypothetical protein
VGEIKKRRRKVLGEPMLTSVAQTVAEAVRNGVMID